MATFLLLVLTNAILFIIYNLFYAKLVKWYVESEEKKKAEKRKVEYYNRATCEHFYDKHQFFHVSKN
jgi:predicted membrane protein